MRLSRAGRCAGWLTVAGAERLVNAMLWYRTLITLVWLLQPGSSACEPKAKLRSPSNKARRGLRE